MKYFLYVNHPNHRVHREGCSGIKLNGGKTAYGNGEWSEHPTRQAAFDAMARWGKRDSGGCAFCDP